MESSSGIAFQQETTNEEISNNISLNSSIIDMTRFLVYREFKQIPKQTVGEFLPSLDNLNKLRNRTSTSVDSFMDSKSPKSPNAKKITPKSTSTLPSTQ